MQRVEYFVKKNSLLILWNLDIWGTLPKEKQTQQGQAKSSQMKEKSFWEKESALTITKVERTHTNKLFSWNKNAWEKDFDEINPLER